MLTRVFLAAGVAALAIAAPAMAGPGGHDQHGGGGGGQAHGGGGGGGGGGHGGGGQSHGGGGGPRGGGGPAFMGGGRGHGGGGGGQRFASPQMRAPQMHSYARQQFRGSYARQQFRGGSGHQQFRMAQRTQSRSFGRSQSRSLRGRQQFRMAGRQQGHGLARQSARSFARNQGHGVSRQQMRMAQRRQFQGNRAQMRGQQAFAGRQSNAQLGGQRQSAANSGRFAGPQLRGNATQLAGSQFANRRFGAGQFGNRGNFNAAAYAGLSYGNNVRVMPFQQANRFIGAPIGQVAGLAALAPLPASIQYLYPDTADYYYRYGDGYLYQVDRGTDLIAALIPLLAGGFLPGQYLPVAYMSDYVPDYYGFNAFYPDYGGLCNRYYRGVIYEVDCEDGYVENVVPMYAGGYGVGELLPTAYNYYNVPVQYRGLYYDTPDAGYWYSPGAIYQYDPRTSVITSVAALMGPGLAIGQPLPVGYAAYNVPNSYRAAYYDTPSAWYRYSNGYIYQVDPATQLVTAIVASMLT